MAAYNDLFGKIGALFVWSTPAAGQLFNPLWVDMKVRATVPAVRIPPTGHIEAWLPIPIVDPLRDSVEPTQPPPSHTSSGFFRMMSVTCISRRRSALPAGIS